MEILLGVLVVAVWLFLAWRRRRSLSTEVTQRGWSYTDARPDLLGRWGGAPFDGTTHPAVRHCVEGTWRGRRFISFDYSYDIPGTAHPGMSSRESSVIILPATGRLAEIGIAPREHAAVYRALHAAGRGAVTTGDQAFDNRYEVSANDPAAWASILTPAVRGLLVDAEPFMWRTQGSDLVSWVEGLLQLRMIEGRLDVLTEILDDVVGAPPDAAGCSVCGSPGGPATENGYCPRCQHRLGQPVAAWSGQRRIRTTNPLPFSIKRLMLAVGGGVAVLVIGALIFSPATPAQPLCPASQRVCLDGTSQGLQSPTLVALSPTVDELQMVLDPSSDGGTVMTVHPDDFTITDAKGVLVARVTTASGPCAAWPSQTIPVSNGGDYTTTKPICLLMTGHALPLTVEYEREPSTSVTIPALTTPQPSPTS